MDVAALRRVLFDLYGTVRFPDVAALREADWDRLDALAGATLLQPLLHVQHRGDTRIPAPIAARWQAAHRHAALRAMVREAEMRACVELLDAAGYRPIALKGAWLARHAYPEPAQRPMLDVDLLLDPETALAAWDLLRQHGYSQPFAAELALADLIRLDKHLPPLVAPRGTMFELHHRLWELPGRLDHAAPTARDQVVRERAVTIEGIRFPCVEDMLAHLIVHATYSHRLDCGPRVLADVGFLLQREAIDWAAFWPRAAQEGWRDGARLVLEMVAASRAGVAIDFVPDTGKPVPPALRDDAVQLLFLEPERRASARFVAGTLKGGLATLTARALGQRKAEGEASITRDMASEGGRAGWITSRLSRVAGDLADRDTRRQSGALARLSRWFDA
ncbi:MAG: nucleotidyltransferase family protein [Proteobacteria bacterium]|nr:nucleotidyltransferase family protein [Pseudomonadota bacterium]